jgi:membrane protease YdiL (CAAX protease family)
MRAYLLLASEWIGVIAVVMILAISPALMERRPVKFTQPRQEAIGSISMIVLIIFFTVLFSKLAAQEFQQFIPFQLWDIPRAVLLSPEELSTGNVLTFLGYAAICLLPVIYFVRRKNQPWLSLGLKREMLPAGLQTGAALVLVSIFLRGKVSPLIYGDHNFTQLLLLIASLGAAVLTEMVFRSYLQTRLVDWMGEWQGWLVSSLFTSIWICIPLLGIAWNSLVVIFLYRFLLSCLLGWIYKKSGSIIGGTLYSTIHTWLFWV